MESLQDLPSADRQAAIDRISEACNADVSAYFEEKLMEDDDIRTYLAEVASK
jgi:hypothetical protein